MSLEEAQLELRVISSPRASEVVLGERVMLCLEFCILKGESRGEWKEKTDLATSPQDANSLCKLE